MTLRRRLPQRRGAIAVELEHAGHHFRMQIGCFPDGALGEVFLDAAKQNSGLDAFAADAAILVSLLLQHGATPAEIGHALRRAPDGTAASLVGAVVDRLAEMGRHDGARPAALRGRLAEVDEAWLVICREHGWLHGSRADASANAYWSCKEPRRSNYRP